MGPESVSEWLHSLSIAAKCIELSADTARLLSLLALVLAFWAATALLLWAHPGGPAWGRYWWSRRHRTWELRDAIPGPRGLPVVGSMHLMSGLAHRKLAAAATSIPGARTLMALSLGHTRAVVTCDSDVARDILNSSDFADRPVKESARRLMFHRAIGFAPYGTYWLALRIAGAHLFSPKQIASFAAHRAEIASQMVRALRGCGAEPVQVRRVLKQASLNHVMGFVFGRRYELGEENEELEELRGLLEEGYDLLGKQNWSDHLPALAGLYLQRVRSGCSGLVSRVHRFVTRLIEERRVEPRLGVSGVAPPDFVDVLLSLQGSDRLSHLDMVAVLWEMVFRGTDTVAILIEWVLARLVMHREVQARLHQELDEPVGRGQMVVGTGTTAGTGTPPYLQAVVKETLRLHPPGPLLSWTRLAASDVTVGGDRFTVPAGTIAMVNMWAIARDPTVWPDPLRFDPGRFVAPGGHAADFSVMGSDLRLAPFGSGRRSCPGKGLAMATVELWVAALAHEFEWRSPSSGTAVDMSEVLRLSCELAKPLMVRLRRRAVTPSTLHEEQNTEICANTDL